MTGLNLDALKVTDATSPIKSAARGREAMPNPFGEVVKESHATGTVKAVMVPNGTERNEKGESVNVVTVIGLIRRAAAANGLGVRLEVNEKGNRTEVKFVGKERTARTRKSADDATSEGTDAPAAESTDAA